MSDQPPVPTAEVPRAGAWLALWALVIVLASAALWLTGFRARDLALGVEQGAARVESRGTGEVADEVMSKAIQTQNATAGFWTALVLLGDFVFAPAGLVLRALVTATAFAALAALFGRPIGFVAGWNASARLQGFWALGTLVRAGLSIALARPAETSLALLIPPGVQPATAYVVLKHFELFAAVGWLALGWSAWRRGQANLVLALVVVAILGFADFLWGVSADLMMGAGMRLSLLPE